MSRPIENTISSSVIIYSFQMNRLHFPGQSWAEVLTILKLKKKMLSGGVIKHWFNVFGIMCSPTV